MSLPLPSSTCHGARPPFLSRGYFRTTPQYRERGVIGDKKQSPKNGYSRPRMLGYPRTRTAPLCPPNWSPRTRISWRSELIYTAHVITVEVEERSVLCARNFCKIDRYCCRKLQERKRENRISQWTGKDLVAETTCWHAAAVCRLQQYCSHTHKQRFLCLRVIMYQSKQCHRPASARSTLDYQTTTHIYIV